MKVFRSLLLISVIVTTCVHAGLGADSVSYLRRQVAQGASSCTLRIHVDGLRNSTGVLGAAIFKSASGWPEDMRKSLHHWPTPIATGSHEATAVLENLPPRDYGVVTIHDE